MWPDIHYWLPSQQQNRNNISHLHSCEYFWTLFETTSLLMIQTKANTTPCFMPDAFPTTIQSYKFILGWQRHWVTLVCISHNLVVKKVAHTRLPTVGFRSWSWFLAVSLQVTWVINPAVGCHYFPPGLQLPPQPLRGLLPILLLGEQKHDGCEQFDSFATAIRTRALLHLSSSR